MTPLEITILIECCVSSSPGCNIPNIWNSPAGVQAVDKLKQNEVIGEHYSVTAKGRAWLKFICAVPMPVATWELPKEDE